MSSTKGKIASFQEKAEEFKFALASVYLSLEGVYKIVSSLGDPWASAATIWERRVRELQLFIERVEVGN